MQDSKAPGAIVSGVRPGVDASTCLQCGATRLDQQIGLESSPQLYVKTMVDLFREVRRVLAPHGTLWLNLGDSYAAQRSGQHWGTAQTMRPNSRGDDAYGTSDSLPHRDAASFGLKHKDLVGIPWRVAFALQDDGWWLRSDIVWAKPNPMPESVTDRPTRAHEYVFLLAKNARYYFDQEAVREPAEWNRWGDQTHPKYEGTKSKTGWMLAKSKEELTANVGGRNMRSVWEITTQPFAEAHFATFPLELPRRAIKAGCPEFVCLECGVPRTRIVQSGEGTAFGASSRPTGRPDGEERRNPQGGRKEYDSWQPPETLGWTDCGHNNYRIGRVLDPFLGSGTTAIVARSLERHTVGIELNPEYANLCARRTQQLSLLA